MRRCRPTVRCRCCLALLSLNVCPTPRPTHHGQLPQLRLTPKRRCFTPIHFPPNQRMAFQRKTDENLFAETTMTFGEHLEDLRQCLFKAVIGLAIGFVLGLFVGGRVVEFIQRPLKLALTQYYEDQSLDRVESHLVELRAAGYTLPDDPDTLKKYMSENGLMFEEVFVNPHELLHQLQGSAPPALLPPTQQGSSATNGDTPSSANTTGAKPSRQKHRREECYGQHYRRRYGQRHKRRGNGQIHRQQSRSDLFLASHCRRHPRADEEPQRPRGFRHLHQGGPAGGCVAGKPLDFLSDLELCGRRTLQARAVLRPRFPAV